MQTREKRYWIRIWRIDTDSFHFENDWQPVSKPLNEVIKYFNAKYPDQRFRIDLEPDKIGEYYTCVYISDHPVQLSLF